MIIWVLTIAPPDGSSPIGGINARCILCPTGGINTWLVSEVTPMLRLANQYTQAMYSDMQLQNL
jgi:hypothetical protein